jgi:hypothetical protein
LVTGLGIVEPTEIPCKICQKFPHGLQGTGECIYNSADYGHWLLHLELDLCDSVALCGCHGLEFSRIEGQNIFGIHMVFFANYLRGSKGD